MKQPIYLVIGCPGSGKSWVCEQLTYKFDYVHHDEYIYLKALAGEYVRAILERAEVATRPLLIEAPFSISQTKQPLEEAGYVVHPVFIIEDPDVVAARYLKRESKEIPRGHLTRMRTYAERGTEWGSFMGTSDAVFKHLSEI